MSIPHASRELDALVAEKVMGWEMIRPSQFIPDRLVGKPTPDSLYSSILAYSTNIAAAWQVVEHFKQIGAEVQVTARTMYRSLGECYKCNISLYGGEEFLVVEATASLAICLAALQAVGYEQ